jgi:hypothetical protein
VYSEAAPNEVRRKSEQETNESGRRVDGEWKEVVIDSKHKTKDIRI